MNVRGVWWCVAAGAVACGCGAKSDEKVGGGSGSQRAPAAPAPAPKKPARPLKVTWAQELGAPKAEIEGGGGLRVSGYKGQYHISIELPLDKPGTWRLGDRSGALSDRLTLLDLPILDRLAELAWDGLASVDPHAELELELKDGRAGKVTLPPIDLRYTVAEQLKEAEHRPVLFGQEPDDPKKTDSLFWPDSIDQKFIGKAGKLHELDWVLIVHRLEEPKGSRICGGYRDSAGKQAPDVTLVFKDTEALIHDRRTGEIVDRKVFPPDKTCPMFTFKAAGENEADSTPPTEKIAAWARSKVKR